MMNYEVTEADNVSISAEEARELVEIARAIRKYGPHLWKFVGTIVLTVIGAAWHVVEQVHDVDKRVGNIETALQDHKNNHNHQWSPTDMEPVSGPNLPPSLPSSAPSATTIARSQVRTVLLSLRPRFGSGRI